MSRSTRSAALFAVWLSALTLVPLSGDRVFADVRSEARQHFRRGMALIAERRIEAGVAELERAYETLPHPNVLYNIGSAYVEAGRYEDALDYFERYLLSEPPDTEEVRAIVRAIEARLAATAAALAPEAEPPAAPPEGPAPGPARSGETASEEEILALEEAATQIETLAEVAESETLRLRAEHLRDLASSLREVESAETATPPDGAAPPSVPPAPEPEVSGSPATTAPAGPEERIALRRAGPADLYEETVVSASRFAQNPLDAPNSTTIITRQDIRLSGLTQIGELLRRAAGVHVMRVTDQDIQVGIRGFNQFQSPRVLMLINGRTTYVDALGSTFWGTQPINVEDIERIEVIRGPASALYGANGFSGVVNIVTRAPGEGPGTEATLGVGNAGQIHGTLAASGRNQKLGYRFSGGYNQSDRFSYFYSPNRVDASFPTTNPSRGLQTGNLNAALDYRLRPEARAYAEAGINYGRFDAIGATSILDLIGTGYQSYAMEGITSGWGGLRAFWNRFDAEVGVASSMPFPITFTNDTVDVEAEFAREFELVVDHNLHVGAAYRWKALDWNLSPERRTENHYAGFFQDTMRIVDALSLVLGFRVDRHPRLEKLQFSPRAALIVRPSDEAAIRISSGRAFRTQNFLETYLLTPTPSPVPGVTAVGLGSYYRSLLFGEPPLEPEQNVSSEIGYSMSTDRYTIDVAGYVNRIQDVIIQAPETRPFTLSDILARPELAAFDAERAAYLFGIGGYANDPTIFTVVGGEASVRVFPVRGLDLFANYAINKTFVPEGSRHRTEERTSLHMVNAGAQYRSLFGFDFAADVHYASEQTWIEPITSASGLVPTEFGLPAYYLLNARVGYRLLDDCLELGVAGYNVTNHRHRQHPLGQVVDARVMGTVAARF